jgi:hypothetical protein
LHTEDSIELPVRARRTLVAVRKPIVDNQDAACGRAIRTW